MPTLDEMKQAMDEAWGTWNQARDVREKAGIELDKALYKYIEVQSEYTKAYRESGPARDELNKEDE